MRIVLSIGFATAALTAGLALPAASAGAATLAATGATARTTAAMSTTTPRWLATYEFRHEGVLFHGAGPTKQAAMKNAFDNCAYPVGDRVDDPEKDCRFIRVVEISGQPAHRLPTAPIDADR